MRIIVMRHGEATFFCDDRILSSNGQKETYDTAMQLKSYLGTVDRIICSPKTRAVQTASIVKDVLNTDTQIDYLSELTPSGDVDSVISYVEAVCNPASTVLLVSHLPLVEYLSYELVHMKRCSPSFKTACALVIDTNGRKTDFKKFFTPFNDPVLFD